MTSQPSSLTSQLVPVCLWWGTSTSAQARSRRPPPSAMQTLTLFTPHHHCCPSIAHPTPPWTAPPPEAIASYSTPFETLRLALLNGRTTPELSCTFTNIITLGQSTIYYAITNSSYATSIKSLKVCSGLGRLASQLYAGGCYGALGHAPLLQELSLFPPTTATPAGTSHGPVFHLEISPHMG